MALATGYSWTFRVTDVDNVTTEKTQTVGALEDVGGAKAGTTAYRLTTTKPGGMTISWQEDTGDGIHRHRELDQSGANHSEEVYTPFRTRIDETAAHLATDATWMESYTETITDDLGITTMTEKTETWTVEAVDEPVEVPAGTYCALRLHRTSTAGGTEGSDKRYWFARGVGKVKETGANQTEELVSFSLD
jgi:hypothetical protein